MQPLEELAISELSDILYDFLPGQAHPYANQSISFKGIADKIGLSKFWQGGSKRPSINILLSQTFDCERGKFCQLILEIVKTSIKYKPKELYREKISKVNDSLLKLKFKIPELHDRTFLTSLPTEKKDANIKHPIEVDRKKIYSDLMALSNLEDTPQKRGFEFEKFLNNMFLVFGLKPRESFRVVGEQIDGSIELDNEIYLIEAKWHNSQTSVSELDAFSAKIKRKADWTRGLFISFNGFTQEAVTAFEKGNVNLITMTGQDIYFILEGSNNKYIDLLECLRHKCRYTAETGNIICSALNIIELNSK
ncbi:MAG: restriction endonuclease [Endomicrobia bacterium]|nr:restriction endonuclease [Endomicrobiia bacterium]